ncbi:MAG: rod shape determining protein RodA [Candidatus Paceibacteria bacterium]|jgi:rod shape determining protein RodA
MKFLANSLKEVFSRIDWLLFGAVVLISSAGLITMNSFVGDNTFFTRQVIWIGIGIGIFFVFSLIDFKFLRRTSVITWLFFIVIGFLLSLFIIGSTVKGAKSWIDFGIFSFQPAELAKLVLILLLAKYFSRRHVAIKNVKHIFISGIYAGLLTLLVLVQPDFGSAIIIFFIWLGMVFVSGISKKHVAFVFIAGLISFGFLWTSVFEDYQKTRLVSFIHPLEDIQGAGYNAYQSTITVGSGEFWGKGVGYGTQSRLQFLPEYQTDFIFAAFAEEWGFAGVMLMFFLYGVVIWRILLISIRGATNFEILYGVGLVIMIVTHFTIHVGMNIGLLPVTGITIPFMSYGGTHILVVFMGLGILMGMKHYARAAHRDVVKNEFLGV